MADINLVNFTLSELSAMANWSVKPNKKADGPRVCYSMTWLFSDETFLFYTKSFDEAVAKQVMIWRNELVLKANSTGGVGGDSNSLGRSKKKQRVVVKGAFPLTAMDAVAWGSPTMPACVGLSSAGASYVQRHPQFSSDARDGSERKQRETTRQIGQAIEGGSSGVSDSHECFLNDSLETGAAPAAVPAQQSDAGGAGAGVIAEMSPKEAAVGDSQLKILKRLLARGMNPNKSLRGGGTILHVAAVRGKVEEAEALLACGGDKNALDMTGESALIKAVQFGHWRVAEVLIAAGCDVSIRAWGCPCYSALDRAAQNGSVKLLNLLLRNGAKANAADLRGNTAMHVAAYYGKMGAIEALINAGGSVAAKNDEGLVPLMFAPIAFWGCPIFLTFLARGATMNAAKGVETFGVHARVESAPRPAAAPSPAPGRHDMAAPVPARHAPCGRNKVRGG